VFDTSPFFHMHLQQQLNQTLERTPSELTRLCELIDPQWIDHALAATGKASIRRRKLPAEHVIWLVIGLALFRNQPIWHVVRQLDLCLGSDECVAPSATVQGRQRLGSEPLQELFSQMTRAWGHQTQQPGGLGLRMLAVDGVVWSTPDTPENRQALGDCANQHGAGAWPQIRAVCLMDTYSHELLDACIGGMDQGELTLAASLKAPDHSLTVFDRAYFSAAHLLAWQAAGCQRHWLMRAKDNLRYEVLSTNAHGDQLISMPVSPRAQRLHPHLPTTWQARLIELELAGKTRRFITSLTDAKRYSAKELAARYCQRWEIELGFREIKQSLQANTATLRSKQPDLVRQELWGVLIAYTLMRRLIGLMAQKIKVEPRQIGFHVAAIAIIDILRFAPLETAGTLPRRLAALFEQAHLFVLPPRRNDRSFPRAVKRRVAKYPVKMPVRA
jgi:Insertion element 4 transposase N-terminal/Transposase DDE domain